MTSSMSIDKQNQHILRDYKVTGVKVSVYKKYFINNTPSLSQYMPLYKAYSSLIPCPILIRISIIPLI